MNRIWRFWIFWVWGSVMGAGVCVPAGAEDRPPASVQPKSVQVSGYGLFQNLRLRNLLREIDLQPEMPVFEANFVEDSFFLIRAQLRRDGFLRPVLTAELTLEDGRVKQVEWSEGRFLGEMPEDAVVTARFRIDRGVLFFYDDFSVSGLVSLSEESARELFFPAGFVFDLPRFRHFSPDGFARGQRNLVRRLQLMGFRRAALEADIHSMDTESGRVGVRLTVHEGPRYHIRLVRERIEGASGQSVPDGLIIPERAVTAFFSVDREQDFATDLRNRFFRAGFPDASVTSRVIDRPEEAGSVVDIDLIVRPGERTRLGAVVFNGLNLTRERYARSQYTQDSGEWLNRVEVEIARARLARLGIFREVDFSLGPAEEAESEVDGEDVATRRDVVFELKEDARHEFHLIGGYGSYDQLRLGFEYTIFNIFGRAHRTDVRAMQSFKGTAAEANYRIPFLRQWPVSANFRAGFLDRQEISFRREELTTEAGLEIRPPQTDHRFVVRYRFESLRSRFNEAARFSGRDRFQSGSVGVDWAWDRRDFAVAPSRGFRVGASAEWALPALGADFPYQRFTARASYHRPLSEAMWVHFRLEQGALARWGGDRGELPFNRRFFPGGESSVRGYREGAASPRDEDGRILGAEIFTLATAEWERALIPALRGVVFADYLLRSAELGDYPGKDGRLSLGLGLRYSTPLGPLRIEYGHNLTRGTHDPRGTLHISLGSPF
ncbi:MAG: BamA/TamA family outer membrane protein [Opitutales bacterium]|nr:BamA/TamA family outer membrane protein [Opitutales bacterium]